MTLNRYPNPPIDMTPEQKNAWSTLIRVLQSRDIDKLYGAPNTLNAGNLKNGQLMKGFTTVSPNGPYYAQPDDGTILCNSSASTLTVFLTSAVNSQYKQVCVKKIDGNGGTNPVIIKDVTSAGIDNVFAVTISAQNGSMIFSCDKSRWWVLSST